MYLLEVPQRSFSNEYSYISMEKKEKYQLFLLKKMPYIFIPKLSYMQCTIEETEACKSV